MWTLKIKKYFEQSQKIRNIRGFINRIIFPYFVKIFLSFLAFIFVIFFTLKIFKPIYLDKIYNKLSYYFLHYLDLDNYNFIAIDISGNERIANEDIINLVEKIRSDFLKNKENQNKSLIKELAIKIKENRAWISKINVSRTLPNSLNIAIIEYKPFALWYSNNQKYVIDRDGNKVAINEDENFDHLIILSGFDANLHAKSLFNILAINPEISSNVYSATWVGNRRWDIRFENGLLVKMPSSNIDEAWQNLIKIYNTEGALKNLKLIDLRIDRKTYLEYNANHKS